jgi:hypothetical protein
MTAMSDLESNERVTFPLGGIKRMQKSLYLQPITVRIAGKEMINPVTWILAGRAISGYPNSNQPLIDCINIRADNRQDQTIISNRWRQLLT